MALDFTEPARHQTALRVFHEAMVAKLRLTFGERVVEPHAVEVDAETIRKYSRGGLAVWSVVAACEGLEESETYQLRMDCRWAIFVVAGSWTVAGESSPTAKRVIPATYVAESAANWVVRLAHRTRWGLSSGVSEVEATDLKIHNLGVGMKANAKVAQSEHLGLFVVWGSQELDMGANIPPGVEEFPLAELIAGTIEDQVNVDKPEIKTEENLSEFSVVGARLRAMWVAVKCWFRRRRGPDWAELAAAKMNEFVRRELVANG